MSKVYGILLVGLTAVLFNSILIASASVEEAMQKRVEMFKASKANIKKLRKPIRVDDATEVIQLLDFHFK